LLWFALCKLRVGSNWLSRGTDPWKIDLERRTFVEFTGHLDVASALLDDAINRGQAESSSLRPFRSEEWLENLRLGCCVHAHTGVAYGEHDIFPCCNGRV